MKKGFTLIELLVVISIIALLSSVLFSSISSVRQEATLTSLRESAHAIQNQVDIARHNHGLPVGQITGSYCSGCWYYGTDLKNNPSLWFLAGSWTKLDFISMPRDPWGQPFVLQEKEELAGPGDCSNHDQVYSAGPDGFLQTTHAYKSGAPPGEISLGLEDDYIFALTFYNCNN